MSRARRADEEGSPYYRTALNNNDEPTLQVHGGYGVFHVVVDRRRQGGRARAEGRQPVGLSGAGVLSNRRRIGMMTSADYQQRCDPHRTNGCEAHVIIASKEAYSKFNMG